jgi:hypothetical protein
LADIPEGLMVERAFGRDSARHLAFRGRHLRVLALPDRWVSWWVGAVPRGLGMIRRFRPQVIWSTYPIATAHLIGLTLRRLTGIPWVADFRDSMTEAHYPPDPLVRRVYRWIEAATVARCERAVFTAPQAMSMYAERYPELPATRWSLIENGYDERSFAAVGQPPEGRVAGPVRLIHSGLLYPVERNPQALFQALGELLEEGILARDDLRITLRASGNEDTFRRMLLRHGLDDIVELAPAVDYVAALREMLTADGLLLLQASSCNHQIPAKLYEYMRARRPVLALTDPAGDTARTLRAAGVDTIVALDSVPALRAAIPEFLRRVRAGEAPLPTQEAISAASREARTGAFAALLDGVAHTPMAELRSGP